MEGNDIGLVLLPLQLRTEASSAAEPATIMVSAMRWSALSTVSGAHGVIGQTAQPPAVVGPSSGRNQSRSKTTARASRVTQATAFSSRPVVSPSVHATVNGLSGPAGASAP